VRSRELGRADLDPTSRTIWRSDSRSSAAVASGGLDTAALPSFWQTRARGTHRRRLKSVTTRLSHSPAAQQITSPSDRGARARRSSSPPFVRRREVRRRDPRWLAASIRQRGSADPPMPWLVTAQRLPDSVLLWMPGGGRMNLVPHRGALGFEPSVRRGGQAGRFVVHFFEMCVPMCVGFAVGDLVYFRAASGLGYSSPFSELPEVSVLVVTFSMTAPMVGWMLFRRMPRRAAAEMAASMVVLAVALLAAGWAGIVPTRDLALLAHGLMMPAMLVPMLIRLDLYAGRASHATEANAARSVRHR
jgi:hypothetical protein